MKRGLVIAAIVTTTFAAPLAHASSIVDEWASVKTPPPPELKTVTVSSPKTTALLMLDFMNQNCGTRPRCVATLPEVKKLLTEARAKGVPVVYSIIANSTTADVRSEVAPRDGEPSVQSGVDKFFKTDLEKILHDKGIATVIVVGTSANGAVLSTGTGAALRGMNVILPVDGMSSADQFSELYTAWHMSHAPIVSTKVTMTKIDMIKF